jgi:adenylate kinase
VKTAPETKAGSSLRVGSTVVIILGAPGAGKGTQCQHLKNALQIPHISSGEILREHIRRKTKVGQQAAAFLNHGQLVPDAFVLEILTQRMSEPDCVGGFLLDGFPRTRIQAELLDCSLSVDGSSQSPRRILVVQLAVCREAVVARLSGRRICQACGAVFHAQMRPPRVPGICDFDGNMLVKRKDDAEEVVLERLRTYELETLLLIDYYQPNVMVVDGNRSVGAVTEDILRRVCRT